MAFATFTDEKRIESFQIYFSCSSSTSIFLAVLWCFESRRSRILNRNRGRRGSIVGIREDSLRQGTPRIGDGIKVQQEQPMNSPAKMTGATTMLLEVRLRYFLGAFPLSSPSLPSSVMDSSFSLLAVLFWSLLLPAFSVFWLQRLRQSEF